MVDSAQKGVWDGNLAGWKLKCQFVTAASESCALTLEPTLAHDANRGTW